MSEVRIETRKLAKDYHDGERTLHVLKRVDMRVGAGEMVAVMGRSGSGKSTLLNLLGGLDRPTRGSIHLAGMDLATAGDSQIDQVRREQVGLVFQFHHLLPELKAWENVAMPALVARRSRIEARERAHELIERVGLADRADHRPAKLSGGEQQRVAIARALVNDPMVVLADEPTGNLDAEMSAQVIDLLVEMTRTRGKSLVIVTHEQPVADRADRTLHLEAGVLQ